MKTLRKVLSLRWTLALGALAGLLPLAAPALADELSNNSVNSPADESAGPAADSGQGYGYFRLVDGPATVTPSGGDEKTAAEVNQPVLAGDRVSLPRRVRDAASKGRSRRLAGTGRQGAGLIIRARRREAAGIRAVVRKLLSTALKPQRAGHRPILETER